MFEAIPALSRKLFPAIALLLVTLSSLNSPAQEPIHLIAHRGGIMDCHHPQNSAGAAEKAIRRGYWMLEIDLQETKDGHIVVHHDDLQKSFGVLKMPGEMTWAQIRQLRAVEDHSHPLEFSEFARLCKGKIRLMIDTKPPHHPRSFYESMEKTLRENGLLDTAYFIGTAEARAYFKGNARISISPQDAEKALAAGDNLAPYYFLFDHGTTLNAKSVATAKRAGIPLVVSINADQYAGRDEMIAVHTDIEKAKALGVTLFQIDSPYDVWLR